MQLSDITALVLAGGLGTRLKSRVPDRPKVLAEVLGRPFLARLLDQLASAGLRRVVVCTGYAADAVEAAIGPAHLGLSVAFSREPGPLGTGGALRLALPLIDSEVVLAVNGDSYVDADLKAFADFFARTNAPAALLLTEVKDASRFGRVTLGEDGGILGFEEKCEGSGPGLINAGVYLLRRETIGLIPAGKAFSLERELFPKLSGRGLVGFKGGRRFIDIGTPESYDEASAFFRELDAANAPRGPA